jgi:hypothetical protein
MALQAHILQVMTGSFLRILGLSKLSICNKLSPTGRFGKTIGLAEPTYRPCVQGKGTQKLSTR